MMNLDGITDLRGFDPGNLWEITTHLYPIRCGMQDGELVRFAYGTREWMTAPYEVGVVEKTPDPNVKIGTLILYSRVLPLPDDLPE